MPEFGTKNAWFMYFCAEIWKQFCHIWYQHPRIFLLAKFCEKTKMPKFGTKNALFCLMYFWARILEKKISYLKSAPLSFSNCKILWNKKNA